MSILIKCMKYAIDAIFMCIFIFSFFIIYIIKDEVLLANNIISVQWCQGADTKNHDASDDFYGIFLYLDQAADGRFVLRARVHSHITYHFWEPYYFYETDVIATVADKKTAIRQWGRITCNHNGSVTIGDKPVTIPQNFMLMD